MLLNMTRINIIEHRAHLKSLLIVKDPTKAPDIQSGLKGLKILDVAGGSEFAVDWRGKIWEPHFARLAAELGAVVTVLDLADQSEEDSKLFIWAAIDIVTTVLNNTFLDLDLLSHKYDIINANAFVGNNPTPSIENLLHRNKCDLETFEATLIRQLFTLLNPGGVMFLNQQDTQGNTVYIKNIDAELTKLTLADLQ
jgi:2-polyprenyl-3-methyl-5-hydroxy-6-metoxy-1,4-benzoquinol methylase